MWIKRGAYAVATIVVLVGLLVASVYLLSERRFARTYTIAAENVESPSDSASLVRGAHLANTIGCAECHGDGLRGAAVIDAPPMGRLVAPNLTSGQGGVGP